MAITFLALAAALLGCTRLAAAAEYRITTVSSFTTFANNVNSGTTYSGTTVFLDADLSLSGQTVGVIGTSATYQFRGVFDGQGYAISNLKMTSSVQYTGLFGYSTGLIIRNVVLDSSCSIISSYASNASYVGGIIGYLYSNNRMCYIENIVNMGSVSFSGVASGYSLYLGGIAGYLYVPSVSGSNNVYVKNCANYGSVAHTGTTSSSYIGGVFGYSENPPSFNRFYNCLNYGSITHTGTTSSTLNLGGIAGFIKDTYIYNSVSAGKITSSKSTSIGSVVGRASSNTHTIYCYHSSELSGYSVYGTGTTSSSYVSRYDSTTFSLAQIVSIKGYSGDSLFDALNAYSDYSASSYYSHWLLNKGSNTISFTINGRANPIKMNSQIILFPNIANEGNLHFDGWYTSSACTSRLDPFEVTSDTSLYGKFGQDVSCGIKFYSRGGAPVSSKMAKPGTFVSLPSNLKKGECTIAFWENTNDNKVSFNFSVPYYDTTLYAVWKCTHIESVDDLTDFTKVVNSGTNYYGTTVFLDTDLSLSGQTVQPIGSSSSYPFRGVFDGQGHAISNLAMTSSSYYTGLFGRSTGLTVRNVVLDSSCSITNTYSSTSSSDPYIGGIIGYCYGSNGVCNLENNVNMASVTFSGKAGDDLWLGGIVGYLSSSSHESTVKNCVNYGSIVKSGTTGYWSYIGGIVGHTTGSYYNYIYNCLNYGSITHSGPTARELRLGGIVGYSQYTYIENCVSAGKITSLNNLTFIGSIVGRVISDTYISYCYHSDELSGFAVYGTGTPSSASYVSRYNSTTFNLAQTVSTEGYSGTSLIDILNANSDYYTLRDYSHWLLNKGSNTVSFTINGRTSPIKMNYQIILLPSLASEGVCCLMGGTRTVGAQRHSRHLRSQRPLRFMGNS